MFHKVKDVKAMPGYRLHVEFISGEIREYDITPLFEIWEPFNALKDVGLFERVKTDTGGYGISWNDEIDLSCEELYAGGRAH